MKTATTATFLFAALFAINASAAPFRLMGEQNTGTGSAGDESFIYDYDTNADLLANNWSSFSATQIDWASSYATAGLAYDGTYRLMGEQDTGTGSAGDESFIYNYDTYADLLANNWSGFSATQIDWASNYATAGLAYESVPEPSIIALFATGLFGIGFARLRKGIKKK